MSMENPNLPGGPLSGIVASAVEYMADAGQRSVLFLDIMRQRGDQYREHVAQTAPHVLSYEAELIIDGRKLEQPVNYALVRIMVAGSAVFAGGSVSDPAPTGGTSARSAKRPKAPSSPPERPAHVNPGRSAWDAPRASDILRYALAHCPRLSASRQAAVFCRPVASLIFGPEVSSGVNWPKAKRGLKAPCAAPRLVREPLAGSLLRAERDRSRRKHGLWRAPGAP